MGLASFIFGILSILSCLSGVFWFPLGFGAMGTVLGAVAMRRDKRKLTIAGFVLSIVGIGLALLMLLAFLSLAAWASRNIGYFT